MGFAMQNLEYLSHNGYILEDSCRILDIGSQNLYHATPEAIVAFAEQYGAHEDKKALYAEAKRISYFSWPRPGERTSYLSELLDLTRIEYTSYDVCPALKTEIFDLNEDSLPPHYKERFDIILNFGTTEHVINQLNTFRVMHDALKVGGVFFHQPPSVGWIGHGYFCYHEDFFLDLAKANGYEVLDRWYSLAGQSSLEGRDIRDPEEPEIPNSGKYSQELLIVPSFNFNIVLRKMQAKPFAVRLELATSHSAVAPDVASLYAGGGRTFDANPGMARASSAIPPSDPAAAASAIPGRVLAKELGRRIARRLGFRVSPVRSTPASEGNSPNPGIRPEVVASPTETPPAVLAAAPVIPPPHETGMDKTDAMSCVLRARALREQGRTAEAFGLLNHARAIVHQFPHAMLDLRGIAQIYADAAAATLRIGDVDLATRLNVIALEADPTYPPARALLGELERACEGPDTTRTCYVFYDPARAEVIHREAIRRCLEYTAIAGVVGDILEFGVLAGWSARLFAETMRDCMVMGRLLLFDSFAGLPEYASLIDRGSYEIAGRNIWADKMKFPDDFVAALGGDLAKHIQGRLSTVLRAERIEIRKGFYSESLQLPIVAKAALVHIDCDLYQSTAEVLEALLRHDVLQDGCVIMFDDWNCNKANPAFGERRAFSEFLAKQSRFSASEFFSYGFNGMVFILHDLN